MTLIRSGYQESGTPNSNASTISVPISQQESGNLVNTDPGNSEELSAIQEELQNVLEYVDQGMILKSFETLCRLTEAVSTNCEELGLTLDGGAIDQKAGFWTGLNNCWLFAFSNWGNARSNHQKPQRQHLLHLHRKVKAWADTLEKYGLVNYELGLWEQDILEAIEFCLFSLNVLK